MHVATPVQGVTIQSLETLPDGVKVIHTSVGDYQDYKRLPKAVSHNGCLYGKSGWNSDRMCAYYRTDVPVAVTQGTKEPCACWSCEMVQEAQRIIEG
jgi:hypothetical protein